jgi:hypothetical protein
MLLRKKRFTMRLFSSLNAASPQSPISVERGLLCLFDYWTRKHVCCNTGSATFGGIRLTAIVFRHLFGKGERQALFLISFNYKVEQSTFSFIYFYSPSISILSRSIAVSMMLFSSIRFMDPGLVWPLPPLIFHQSRYSKTGKAWRDVLPIYPCMVD